MAVSFLDEILVKLNGTSSSKKYLQLNGGGASGSVSGQAGIGFRPLNAGSNVHASIEGLENGTGSYQTHLTFSTNGSSSDSAPSERMRITSAGNVGIGITSPGAKLDVLQEARISYAAGNQYRTRITNTDGNTRMLTDGNNASIIFGTSAAVNNATATEKMRITSAGNVGVGTTVPSQKLTVNGTIMSTGASNPQLILQDSTHSDITIKGDSGIFSVTNQSVGQNITMLYNGNIGIGTTAPTSNLHILGSASPSYQLDVSRDNDGTGGPNIKLFHSTASPSTSDAAGSIYFAESKTGAQTTEITYGRISVLPSSVTSNAEGGAMTFALADGVDASVDEAMRITQDGKVGIGTTAPNRLLTVQTTSSGSYLALNSSSNNTTIGSDVFGSFIVYDDSSAAYRMVINQTTGNVGIGTTSPSQKLEVSGKAKITTSLAVGAITPSTTTGRIDASNDIVAYSTSDIRLKDNIKSIDKALDKVNSIQGIEFDWIEKEEVHGNSGHDVGVIAQEIEKILPDVVTTRDSGYKAVKYEKIVPLLIEAIKDLSKQVDGLKRLI
jgi:hypothetical protein